MTTLTVTLGFNGGLRLRYPNGKYLDLPPGTAEARMLEILEGFRRSERAIQATIDRAQREREIAEYLGPITKVGRRRAPTVEELLGIEQSL